VVVSRGLVLRLGEMLGHIDCSVKIPNFDVVLLISPSHLPRLLLCSMLVRRPPLSFALYCLHVEGVNEFPRVCYINFAHLYN
jgi:hypothetical protein